MAATGPGGYYGSCARNYCQQVWDYYQDNADWGTSSTPWGWPTSGTITQGPYEGDHVGIGASSIDIGNDAGTPIYATQDGTLTTASQVGDQCLTGEEIFQPNPPPNKVACGGLYVIVKSSFYMTYYMHLQKFSPCAIDGKFIKAGELIGYMDSTGTSTGNHVHYTIKDGSNNPLNLVEWNKLVPAPTPYQNNVQKVATMYTGVNCK